MIDKNDRNDKTTMDIKKAELISNELKCDIWVSAIDNITHGKAHLIETLPLTESKTTYTVLQQDTKNGWVSMETTLSANESITRQFRKKKKTAENTNYGQIPTYIMLFVVTVALFYFVWLTLSRKLLIFESKDIWLIVLGFLLFIVVEFLISYYIFVQTLEVISFQSYSHPRMETYTIHFEGRVQTINAMLYRGRFVDFRGNTAKYVFGYSASEIQGGLRDSDDGEYYIDKIRYHVTEAEYRKHQLVEVFGQVQAIQSKIATLRYSRSAVPQSGESSEQENEMLSDLEKQEKDVLERYNAQELELQQEIQKHETAIEKIQQKYSMAIQNAIGREIDERKKHEIINADETISKLKNEVARMKIQMLGMTNSYNGVVTEYSDLAERVNERVHMSLAESETNVRSILIQQNSMETSGAVQQQSRSSRTDVDIGAIIEKVVPILIVSIVFIVIINKISGIIEALSLLDSWAIAAAIGGAIILLLMLVMIFSRIWNRGHRYSKDADSSHIFN